jgi:uncharacterized protein YndB with AHSA1/START domain
MTAVDDSVGAPVRKSVIVNATRERAFQVFTEGFDAWWPRTHHIGKAPMRQAIIEGRSGGRCYTIQEDGTECPWGTVLMWDPPARLVLAWQITHQWGYEADLAKSSEVEIRFTAEAANRTRVDLEHRGFERHGSGGDEMRVAVGGQGGWPMILDLYSQAVDGQ